MSSDQQAVLDWITNDYDGSTAVMPFKLHKTRGLRDSLVHIGLVIKTDRGRYVPIPDKPKGPGNLQGQAERPPEGIA